MAVVGSTSSGGSQRRVEGSLSQNADSMVELVNEIFSDAAAAGASDIHVEPQNLNDAIVRIRVDGLLQVKRRFALENLPQFVSRVKIMARLDVTEHRLPLDGRISWEKPGGGARVDMRVSTVPLLLGEKVCVRIIYKEKEQSEIDHLGFNEHNLKLYKSIVESPNGLLLHCGPAGSGKTTSLYAAVRYLNSPTRNISTVEDPIEYQLAGVNQAQVNPDIGLTFAKILRAYMRQDCNVILVGEVRDQETCEIAIEAALTGHMILGTMHASSAVGAIARLQELGITNYFIGAAIRGIVSQRLVRKLCQKCKQATTPPPKLAEAFQLAEGQMIYKAVGCKSCGQMGYKGRMVIQEILKPDDDVRELIYNGASPMETEAAAFQAGMVPLWLDGLEKAKAGDTSIDEVVRIVKGVTFGDLKKEPAKPPGRLGSLRKS